MTNSITSREIVKRAIHFKNPSRIPYNYDSNRTTSGNYYGDDFIWCFLDANQDIENYNARGNRVDEWGCIWETMGETFGEPTAFPLEGKEFYAQMQLPDYLDDLRYQSIRHIVSENNLSENPKYVLAMLPLGIFQIMIHLFGFEDFMYQIAGNTEEFSAFADKLCDMCEAVIKKMADCGVDGVILIEDMGLQDRMMVSPQMWEDIYFPLYSRMFSVAHKCGLDVFSHTCGHIVSILDMYIKCGLDVIQMDQQDNMGIPLLGDKFKNKVCFFCSLDIQTSIAYTREEIFICCEEMVANLATVKGGFMAKTYPQPEAIHITHEYMQDMTDGFAAANEKLYRIQSIL